MTSRKKRNISHERDFSFRSKTKTTHRRSPAIKLGPRSKRDGTQQFLFNYYIPKMQVGQTNMVGPESFQNNVISIIFFIYKTLNQLFFYIIF
jgi:hypothetical protein